MTERRPPEPSLWCVRHDRWEPTARACNCAFDPDKVDWLESSVDAESER